MQTTPYRGRAVFMAQWLMGLAMAALVIPVAPSVVFGQPDPTGKVPGEVELPVDISIDIATDDEAALPKPDVTIHLLNTKSGTDVDLALPKSNVASDHPSSAVAQAPFVTPPVETPFGAPSVATPPLDVPVTDFPPIEPPTVDAPPVDAPSVSLPPNVGRP